MPVRTVLVFFALLCASAGLTAVNLINNSAKEQYAKGQQPLLANVFYHVKGSTNVPLTKALYASLRRQGFNQLVAVNRTTVTRQGDTQERFLSVIGIDSFAILSLPSHTRRQQFEQSNGYMAGLSDSWQSDGRLLIHPDFAAQLNASDGETLITSTGIRLPPLSVNILPGLGRQLVTDIATFQRVFKQPHIDALYVVGDVSADDFTALKRALPPGTSLESMNTGEQAAELTKSFHLNIFAMSLLMFVVCMFIAANAMNLLLSQREPNVKVLRQLGVSRNIIAVSQSVEMLCLGATLSIPGVFAGIALAGVLAPTVLETLNNLFGVHVGFGQSSFANLFLLSATSCGLGAFLAALAPLYRLNQRVYSKAEADEPQIDNRWLLASLLMLALSYLIWRLADSVAVSFIVIALLVFAGSCMVIGTLPKALRNIARLIPKSKLLTHYTCASAVRLSRRSKVAYCAFFIAVAANLGMNLMVDSFRQATHDWISQRLDAQAYLTVPLEARRALAHWQHTAYSDVTLIPRLSMKVSHQQDTINVRSYPANADLTQVLQFDLAEPTVEQMFGDGVGALINQQWMFSQGVSLGDKVSVTFPDNTVHSFVVAGIYKDYGNPSRQMMLPLEYLRPFNAEITNYAVSASYPDQIDALTRQLDEHGIEHSLYKKDDIVNLSMDTFDKTFAITESLNIVTLLVAAFSLAVSILILNKDQAPEQALMRSIGLSRRTMFSLSCAQYLIVTTMVAMIAIPFGVLLSWLLINLVNVQAFHWRYPLVINVQDIIVLISISISLVIFAAAIPLFKRANHPLTEELKWLG